MSSELPPFEITEVQGRYYVCTKVGRAITNANLIDNFIEIGPPFPGVELPIFMLDDHYLSPHFLVLEYESGVAYTMQVGGLSCIHPQVEGILLPLTDHDKSLEQLAEASCQEGCHGGPLPVNFGEHKSWPKELEVMGDVFWGAFKSIRFDPRRAEWGMECFIPVVATFKKKHDQDTNVRPPMNAWLFLQGNCD